MPDPYEIVLGPFIAGRTGKGKAGQAGDGINPNTAFDCTNVDISDGSIRARALPSTVGIPGASGLATEFGGIATGRGLVYVPSTATYASGDATDRKCYGLDLGIIKQDTSSSSILIQEGNVSSVQWAASLTNTDIGFTDPGNQSSLFTAGSGGSPRVFVVTFVANKSTYRTEIESNPSFIFYDATATGGTFTRFTPPAAFNHNRFTSGVYRVYASVNGSAVSNWGGLSVTDPRVLTRLFLVAQINPGAGSTIIGNLSTDLNNPLTWASGVFSDNPIYNIDEQRMPVLWRVSNAMHSTVNPSNGVEGMLVASDNRNLYLAEPGFPWYNQTAYQRGLPDFTEMIRSNGALTVVSTLRKLYTVTGTSPSDALVEEAASGRPVRYNSGDTGHWTPWGLVYVGNDGIYLFDGSSSINLTENSFTRDDFTAWPEMTGIYLDGFYAAFGFSSSSNSTGVSIDMRRYPDIVVSKLTLNLPCNGAMIASSSPASDLSFKSMAYVKNGSDNRVYPWLPHGDAYGGSFTVATSSTYQWITQRIGVDEKYPKSFQRLYLDYEGTSPTINWSTWRYGKATPVATGTFTGGTDMTQRRFSADAVGDYLFLTFNGVADTVIRRCKVTGSILNGRP